MSSVYERASRDVDDVVARLDRLGVRAYRLHGREFRFSAAQLGALLDRVAPEVAA